MTPPVNWQTDHLLYPSVNNRQISLNDMLAARGNKTDKRTQLIAQPLNNYYGLLIRRIDFRRKNSNTTKARIPARMPYLPLTNHPNVKDLLKEHGWLVAEAARDYFYQSAMNDNSIKSWKQRIDRYFNRGAIPLPILRGNKEIWQQLTEKVLQEQQLTIQSAKGEQTTIPLKLTEKLVYLLGVIDGDGHLSKHQVHIVDYSRKHIEQLQQFFQELFAITGEIREGKEGNYYILLVNSKWIVRLVNFLTGHPVGRKYDALREPRILTEDQWIHLRGAYWRGLFDADASYKEGPVFCTISEKLASDLQVFLQENNIKSIVHLSSEGFSVYIPTGFRQRLFSIINSWHPIKLTEFKQLLQKNWYGEIETFQGLYEKKLLPTSHFNFLLLPRELRVLHSGGILKQMRTTNDLTLTTVAMKMGITKSLLGKYEQQKLNPTLHCFKTLLNYYTNEIITPVKFMTLLEKQTINKFTYKTAVAKFPFKATQTIQSLMKIIQPRKRGMLTVLTDDLQQVKTINEIFGINYQFDSKRKLLLNKALHAFLITFGHYSVTK